MKEKYFTSSNIRHVSDNIKAIAGSYSRGKTFDFRPSESALLVLDMQHYFLSESSPAYIPSAKVVVPIVQSLIDFYEKHELPVFYTRHMNNYENALMMGRWWQRLLGSGDGYSQLIYEKPGLVISKSQYDAFYKTELDSLLASKKQLIICGLMTHLCCETTLRSAFVRGFEVLMPVDATATYNLELHQSTYNTLAHGFCPPLLVDELLNHRIS